SSSRGADFAQLAELISRLVKQANLPVTPVTAPAAA
ncbi:MAG: hydrogen peroxide-inducible genes activator, partial [Actinomyces oris]